MSVFKSAVTALALTGLLSSQALALTITNRDAKPHSVTVKHGDEEKQLSLPEGAMIEEACDEGCTLRLAGAEDDYAGGKDDKFVIQNDSLQREAQ